MLEIFNKRTINYKFKLNAPQLIAYFVNNNNNNNFLIINLYFFFVFKQNTAVCFAFKLNKLEISLKFLFRQLIFSIKMFIKHNEV